MTETAQGRLGTRLRRILLLLPYAIKNPGVTIDELSDRFGVKKKDLIGDLNLVFVCGLPGYGPGDLIDVSIENDQVFVHMADYFSSPLRITPAEALSLYVGGAAVIALPEMDEADALRRALGKLGHALGIEQMGTGTGGIAVRWEPGPANHLRLARQALQEQRRMRLEYFSAHRGELSTRTMDPWGLVAALGHWYLIGFDRLRNDERMFRVDRIKEAEVLDEAAEIPDDFDPSKYRGAFVPRDEQDIVSFEISSAAARWFEDYYPLRSSRELDDGWRAVELTSGGTRWAATLVLRLGDQVRAVQPESVLTEARALANALTDAHS
ncbi:MAG: WYL domain-containing protein [Actinomycetota bacterium]|nr:WYL domain-containing protein [Actinomycetota bacterium]